jgi:hypothetical protein
MLWTSARFEVLIACGKILSLGTGQVAPEVPKDDSAFIFRVKEQP